MRRDTLSQVTLAAILLGAGCGGGSLNAPGGGTPVPSITLSTSKSSANVGEAITLTWSSTDATSCTASATPTQADWSGNKPTSGSAPVAPTPAGSVTYSLSCTGAGGSSQQSAMVTAIAPTLTITSGPLPAGRVGTPYGMEHQLPLPAIGFAFFFKLNATGAVGSLTWSWAAATGSSLPPGLGYCDRTFGGGPVFGRGVMVRGEVSGTPTASGDYTVVITVNDSASGASTSTSYPIHVDPPPPPVVSTTPSPAIGTLNEPYVSYAFTVASGFPPIT